MKTQIFFVLSLMLLAQSAFAARIVGQYSTPRSVLVMYVDSEEGCKTEGGEWEANPDGGMCFVEASDNLEIKATKKAFRVHITTMGNNLHMCEFSARATLKKNVLTSKVKVEEYNAETGEMEPAVCVVRTTIKAGVASVVNNEKCQSFCGVNTYLEGEFKKAR